jgi:hypothetical protein
MANDNNFRLKWLTIRLSDEEYDGIRKQFQKTTERKISTYSRKVLLSKPLVGTTRNLTQEALIAEFAGLIKILNGISNNFNQAVHKLHMLDHEPQFKEWILKYEMDKRKLLKDVEYIRKYINETAAQWLLS